MRFAQLFVECARIQMGVFLLVEQQDALDGGKGNLRRRLLVAGTNPVAVVTSSLVEATHPVHGEV